MNPKKLYDNVKSDYINQLFQISVSINNEIKRRNSALNYIMTCNPDSFQYLIYSNFINDSNIKIELLNLALYNIIQSTNNLNNYYTQNFPNLEPIMVDYKIDFSKDSKLPTNKFVSAESIGQQNSQVQEAPQQQPVIPVQWQVDRRAEQKNKKIRERYHKRANKLAQRVNEFHAKQNELLNFEKSKKKDELDFGTRNEDHQKLEAQYADLSTKLEKKEKSVGIKKEATVGKTIGFTKKGKEIKQASLIEQRDILAAEMNKMRTMYGTVNNEEYQMRAQQLKELDKKIFGHKATKIYKDLNKPIALIGGTSIEIPKNFLDMRLSNSKSK